MAGSSPTSTAPGSPTAEMLTPRSKVAKMLADIDAAPTPSPPTRTSAKNAAVASGTGHTISSSPSHSAGAQPLSRYSPAQRSKGPFEVDSEADSDEDDLDAVFRRRPQGRAARRMLGQQASSPASNQDHALQAASSPAGPQTGALDDDDDEDLYSATPLKARFTVVSASGSPLGSDAGGLFVSPARSGDMDAGSDEDLPSNPFGSKEKLAELVAQKRNERLRREAAERRKVRERERALSSPVSKTKKRLQQRKQRPSPHASSDLPDDVLEGSQEATEPNRDVERIMSDAARPTRKASKKALLEMERETQRMARQQALAHQMKVKKKFTTSDLLARFGTRRPQSNELAVGELPHGSSSAVNSDGAEMMTAQEPVSTPPSSPPTAGPTPLDKQKAMVELGALSKLMPVREDSIASLAQMLDSDEELPGIADVLSSAREAKQAVAEPPTPAPQPAQERRGLKLARLGKKAAARQYDDDDDDDLDIIAPLPKHLQVFDKIKPHDKHTGTDNKALHTLKHLAHFGAYETMPRRPAGKNGPPRPSIGAKTLEAQLRRKAKEQARLRQAERIAELKAKGVVVQTAEEREKEAEVFEDLLERARREAVELGRAEKAAAKRESGGDGGEGSEDEDEEYVGSGSEEEGGGEEGEGEDEEEEDGLIDEAAQETDGEGDDEDDLEDNETSEEPLVEHEVQEDQLDPTQASHIATPAIFTRKPRPSRIIQDEDDDDDNDSDRNMEPDTMAFEQDTTAAMAADDDEEEDPFAAFNFGANASSDALMSPTQAFQATMQSPTQATQEDSLDILRRIAPPSASATSSLPPPPTFPPTFPPCGGMETQEQEEGESQLADSLLVDVVPGSQVPESQRIELGWETQPQPQTPGWEPTQDAGLPSPWTIGVRRESTVGLESVAEEHETQETVRLRVSESPAAPAARRGRLVRRRAALSADSSDEDDEDAGPAPSAAKKLRKQDAFREMARRRAAALTAAERVEAEREMKRMLEEQAEESEDEYAGLGGDDFVAPETEEDKAMIDTENVEVDERALAAHFAARQRVADEAATSKLFKDITTGGLRRKQAGNASFGLEEDEDELAVRRRGVRQREEARKRRVLLQDDNIAGLVAGGRQSKGKEAFLRAIADGDERDFEDELGLSDGGEGDSQQAMPTPEESQLSSLQGEQAGVHPEPLREVSGNKRRFAEGEDQASSDRPPAKLQRRTLASAFRTPISLLEVRESVSFLLDDPDSGLAGGPDAAHEVDEESAAGSSEYGDSEADDMPAEEDDDLEFELEAERSRQNDGGFAAPTKNNLPRDLDAQAMPPPPRLPASQRRTAPKNAAVVVDRLSLKRAGSSSSSNASASASGQQRTAWAASSLAGGFKAPSLLRRATTTSVSSGSSSNDRGVTTSTTASLGREGSGSGSGVKMGGSKKSSLAYQARAEERRAIVEAGARRREANTARIAGLRRESSSALGKGLGGRFE
ncbi:hypothetical protein LTR36_010945 [Oleoguttula mirabilis]|uniref:DNA replication checkpoint mediator MRC1 domain-containing protein n=1 Tax=Oleoguttula mirabilis TaxID=1507867 RepID=A0AAV9J3G3_9PEZI|nr:hypothetical protein LTR36_010945 [Oleoguttula mirabilis]